MQGNERVCCLTVIDRRRMDAGVSVIDLDDPRVLEFVVLDMSSLSPYLHR